MRFIIWLETQGNHHYLPTNQMSDKKSPFGFVLVILILFWPSSRYLKMSLLLNQTLYIRTDCIFTKQAILWLKKFPLPLATEGHTQFCQNKQQMSNFLIKSSKVWITFFCKLYKSYKKTLKKISSLINIECYRNI